MGGAVAAIEAGFYQDEIHEAAFRIQRGIEAGERVIVGVNRFEDPTGATRRTSSASTRTGSRAQIERTRRAARRARRRPPSSAPSARSGRPRRGTGNLLPPMQEALRARATLGEVSDVLRRSFGEYHPT